MLKSTHARIQSFRVVPSLPKALEPLHEIAHNLWWSWHPEAASLFRRLDRELWRTTNHNPVMLLGLVSQEKLEKAAEDRSYLHALGHVHSRLQAHMTRNSWFQQHHPELAAKGDMSIAYFSAEFGLTECLQIYSGGLGVLSGDHLKSASEIGIPLIGVGLLYRCGYFHQYLNADGWQQETYPELDYHNQPVHRVIDPKTNEQMRVTVALPGRDLHIAVWRCNVGRVPLYLLDTNIEGNAPHDREITRNLYGGDVETRIQQELVLGVGGMRALAKLGIQPSVYHMNEGHSAFLGLEHIRMLRERHGIDFDTALSCASAQHLFTTHTPVPAGIDRFSPELVARYFEGWHGPLGISGEHLLGLGRENEHDPNEFFSMAVLALKLSQYCNGVSKLHGKVSRRMWKNLWPGVPEEELPIGHVTNGVHARSWIAPDLGRLYDRYMGSAWLEDPTDREAWKGVSEIPDDELWQIHVDQRQRLVRWCRQKIREQLRLRGVGPAEIEKAASALDPNALTIGFARRFATYKRATLFLQDKERLLRLLQNDEQPVQFLIAGKAHPADTAGKELIRELVNLSKEAHRADRVVFLEDYDISVARRLVTGCDIWLNTPRRGLEASGTSGMKAAMNGVINLSVMDGWWDEAFDGALGFSIGRGESYDDSSLQDQIESRALFDLLERQILPEFYTREVSGTPKRWVARMKRCIQNLTPAFNTNRMVAEYHDAYYKPVHLHGHAMSDDNLEQSRDLSDHLKRYMAHWQEVSVLDATSPVQQKAAVRSSVPVQAVVSLGQLTPEEVSVQLYHGNVTAMGDLVGAAAVEMRHVRTLDHGRHEYTGEFSTAQSGRHGFSVRVIPRDGRLATPFVPGLITWHADDASAASEDSVESDDASSHFSVATDT